MDQKSARRLRILGLSVLALFFIFAFPVGTVTGGMADPYKNALATTLAFGIGLLLLAEIGPLVTSLKAGGLEVTFTAAGDKFNEFETRLARLEWAVAHSKEADNLEKTLKPAPARKRKPCRRNDPWKGRFGRKAIDKNLELSAEFKTLGSNLVQIFLRVRDVREERLRKEKPLNLECVEFYLHDTFTPDVVPAIMHDGTAELSLLSYGGFTVGAWIPCHNVELELDLAELPDAPRIVREN